MWLVEPPAYCLQCSVSIPVLSMNKKKLKNMKYMNYTWNYIARATVILHCKDNRPTIDKPTHYQQPFPVSTNLPTFNKPTHYQQAYTLTTSLPTIKKPTHYQQAYPQSASLATINKPMNYQKAYTVKNLLCILNKQSLNIKLLFIEIFSGLLSILFSNYIFSSISMHKNLQ